jgi:kinesin family protein 3/17
VLAPHCRAKNITNKPHINEDPKDAMLREYQVRAAVLGARWMPHSSPCSAPTHHTRAHGLVHACNNQTQEEIARLKAELQARQAGGAGGADGEANPARVVERAVEVEPDKAALVQQLREQVKQELEQQQQQLEGQALEVARQEAEARARQQLEVRRVGCGWACCTCSTQGCMSVVCPSGSNPAAGPNSLRR